MGDTTKPRNVDETAVERAIREHREAGGRTHHDLNTVAIGARRLVSAVWRLVDRGVINARSPAADAALDLRDSIDPTWNPTNNDGDVR